MNRILSSLLILGWTTFLGFAAEPKLLGRASCATTTCHGGSVNRGPDWNHSLSTWVAGDPHAGAGLLLRDPDSRAIVERLHAGAAKSQSTFDNVLRSRCISCHATPSVDDCQPIGVLNEALLAEGVSCEACHGAAGNWIDDHLRFDWHGPERFVPKTGMLDTESILGRAESCVRCHVGSRSSDGLVRDMNHDLIAAGHPALRFDLLIYNENLPAHWDGSSDVETQFASSAVRVRQVGRAINLATAATLSSDRAADHLSDPSVPWPELADYDCFACHQSLSIDEFETPRMDLKSPFHVSNGIPVWNSWHTTGERELRENRRALEILSPHRSDPARIAESARQLAIQFRDKAEARMKQPINPNTELDQTIAEVKRQPPVDWHQAAIQYLRLDAAAPDLRFDQRTAAIGRDLLEQLASVEVLLRFGTNRSNREDAVYHSPVRFNPKKFQNAILNILSP